MAEQKDVPVVHDEEDDGIAKNYKPPAEKSVEELLKTDAEDESLRKYKESLGLTGSVIVDEKDPRQVIVKKIGLLAEDRPEVELDLTGDLASIKKKPFIIKEGCHYKIKIYFYTQREIVSGLKYIQKSYRKGIQVDKTSYMLGSYPPKLDLQVYTTPVDEAPHGMIARGTYNIKSSFIDDDKKKHVEWEWQLEIKKGWE